MKSGELAIIGKKVFVNGHWGVGVIESFAPSLWCPVLGHHPHYGVRIKGDYLVWVPKEKVEKSLADHGEMN